MFTPQLADMVARLGSPSPKAARPTWIYSTAGGRAVLNRGDDRAQKKLGQYANESLAKKACQLHFQKSCNAMKNLGNELPDVLFN